MTSLADLTIKEARQKLDSKEITSVELTQACLQRIEEKEPEINAFITVCNKVALEQAKVADQRIESGENVTELTGIPYSLKDVFNTKGILTTAGSKILDGYIPPYNATVYQKLKESGAVLLGKTNCDPFGFGSSTEHSAYGITKNPVDTSRVPGGSSGGSGAAVAYGGGLFSIGEDTGGSIRCPASFCGITGLKVTYGLVSRYGSISYASSYDTVGPMAKTTEDTKMVLSVIAGNDKKDATSTSDKEYSYESNPESIKNKTIGIPKEYFEEGLDPKVKDVIENAIERYKKLGCKVKEISLPNTEYAISVYYVIGLSEASSNLARYDGIRFGADATESQWKEHIKETRSQAFSPEAKRRVMIGTYALSAGYADEYYKKAQKVRQVLRKDFLKAFESVDVILTPTMPVLPFKIGENTDDPLKMWLVDAYTCSLNPIGLPGLSIKAGDVNGLPVGMQLIGKHFSEQTLFNFGIAFEEL